MAEINDWIENRIAELRTELTELETALRVNRRVPMNGRNGAPAKKSQKTPEHRIERTASHDLAGTTVLEAAAAVLKGVTEPMYYKDIHGAAARRGYDGGRNRTAGSPVSFWAILRRNRDKFDVSKGGKYKLKEAK